MVVVRAAGGMSVKTLETRDTLDSPSMAFREAWTSAAIPPSTSAVGKTEGSGMVWTIRST
jgi:hypothetical protein